MNPDTFWADTETETIHQLIETVDIFDTPRRALFLASLQNELRRRNGEHVESLRWAAP